METKIREIQPMVAENWVWHDPNPQEALLIQPVVKAETDPQVKNENERKQRQRTAGSGRDPQKNKELAEEVQRFMEDLNIGINLEIHDTTGDMVAQVLNRDTGDVIRQISPEDLAKLHEKLVELRGVLFEEKV